MSRRFGRRKKMLAAIVVALAFAGGAIAYWTTSGSGNAAASVTNPDPVTLSAETPSGFLFPGMSADVAVKITNPNTFRVHVPSLVLDVGEGDGGFGIDGGHSGCDLSALSYTVQDNAGSGWFALASADLSLGLTGAVTLDTSADNACQGAAFTVYLKVGS